jgi:hypothetical protein
MPRRRARAQAEPPDAPAVYLLHLEEPIAGRARHYLGEATSLSRRIREHAHALGIPRRLVRWRPAPREDLARVDLERRSKHRHGSRLCPVCNPLAERSGRLERIRVATVSRSRPRRFGRC